MVDLDSPDQSREGIYRIAEFMQESGVRDAYINFLIVDAHTSKDYTVRAAALRVLNEFRIKSAVPVAIENMEYPESLVQLEAAKALANIPDPAAIPTLVRHLKDTVANADVRIACADALRNFNQADSTDALTAMLGDMDFSVAYQAHESLRIATFHDFQYDKLQWQAFLAQPIRSTH
jgi:HEAT repeat protein